MSSSTRHLLQFLSNCYDTIIKVSYSIYNGRHYIATDVFTNFCVTNTGSNINYKHK